eukprot:1417145-Ditylum_brightwellii.AAC.1
MSAGAQGCIFSTNGPHTRAGNNAQVITAPAGRGNVVQAMLTSPPVTNRGTFVHTSSCTYEDCGMAHSEEHKHLYWFIDCHTRMNNNSMKSHRNHVVLEMNKLWHDTITTRC